MTVDLLNMHVSQSGSRMPPGGQEKGLGVPPPREFIPIGEYTLCIRSCVGLPPLTR
jgi:hypothetical protein